MLNESRIESDRFQLRVFRGEANAVDPRALLAELDERNVDIAILRLPADRADQLHKLDRLGVPYIYADTLVYYTVDLRKHRTQEPGNALEFVPCGPSEIAELRRLVMEIFPGYTNHYSSNPLLEKSSILEGYVEWALSYAQGTPGKISWLVREGDKSVGFATCQFDENTSEGVLYGVLPGASGRGVYTDIVRFTQRYFQEKGLPEMRVSTQIQNHAVQKAWTREGFRISKSLLTVHVNALFGGANALVVPLNVTESMIRSWGEVSGDTNPIHFSRTFAAEMGLTDCIAHGLACQGMISRVLGNELPGPGTLILSSRDAFLQPLYLNRSYDIHFGFPRLPLPKGYSKASVRVRDKATGRLCAVAQYDLLKRERI